MPAKQTTVEPGVEQLSASPSRPQPPLNAIPADKEARHREALNLTRATGSRAPREPRTDAHPKHRRLTLGQAALAKHAFLEAYGHYGNIGHCADLVGISRNTVYNWQESDEDFALGFQQAEKRALETLEHEAWRRAIEGNPYTRTSYYRGEPVGTDHKIEYSDQLLTLLLRARAPERYRERMDVNVSQVVKAIAGVDPASVL